MNIKTIVMSTPKPRGYLGITLSSLARAGWPVTEVSMRELPPTDHFREIHGRIIHERLGWHGHKPWFLISQDDVAYPDNLLRWLKRQKAADALPTDGVLSLFLCRRIREQYDPGIGDGWWAIPDQDVPGRCWGACSYLFPWNVLDRMLSVTEPTPPVELAVGHAIKKAGLRYYHYERSLCEHIGARSTIGHNDLRPAENRFAGEWLQRLPR